MSKLSLYLGTQQDAAAGNGSVQPWVQWQLLPAGCGQKGMTQPIRLLLARISDGFRYLTCFFGAQTHGKHRSERIFPRQPGASHFLCHTEILSVYKKCLTAFYFLFTLSPVLNFKAERCQNNARTPLARLAGQRHPARTGAGTERLAMNADAFQAVNSARKSRSLKVEAIGDFSRGKIIPRIRIAGQWLERAGFKPGHRVQILMEQPGTLSVRFLAQGKEIEA